MTIASDIFHESCRIQQAETEANRLAVEIDQLWAEETTLYFFDDESVLAICGPTMNHYENGQHFDASLTASQALEPAAYDALDGPREQVVAELLRLERMGSGTAAEWLVETSDMTDAEFDRWTRQQ